MADRPSPAVDRAVDKAVDGAVDRAVETAHDSVPHSIQAADAQRVLTAYQPRDAQQELIRLDLLAHLAAHPDAMARSGPPAHFTASCLVLDVEQDHVLLTHHRKARQWYQLGGHLEPGDRGVRAAAEREAREESGIDGLRVSLQPVHLDRHRLIGSFGRCEEHLDIRYVGAAAPGATPQVSAESLDVRWWPVNDLPWGSRDELTPLVAAARAALKVV